MALNGQCSALVCTFLSGLYHRMIYIRVFSTYRCLCSSLHVPLHTEYSVYEPSILLMLSMYS